jgi:hypothetical protein
LLQKNDTVRWHKTATIKNILEMLHIDWTQFVSNFSPTRVYRANLTT